MKLKIKGMRKLGTFGVDSGQVMIVDPCYLNRWKDDGFHAPDGPAKPTGEFSYDGACRQTLYDPRMGGVLEEGLAVVASTGYGDGSYDVYALYKDGRIMGLYIDFEQNPDGTGEEETIETRGEDLDGLEEA